MKAAKIQFSKAETDLMCNAAIILTKNKIIETVRLLLEDLQEKMVLYSQEQPGWEQELFSIMPKISKGENYLGLPYLVLDYPRWFQKDDVFALRTMFWWGNFFSLTLHISGYRKNILIRKIEAAYPQLASAQFYVCINDDAWEHHFEESNYCKMATLTKEQFNHIIHSLPHIKIAARWPLYEWPGAAKNIFEHWKLLLAACLD